MDLVVCAKSYLFSIALEIFVYNMICFDVMISALRLCVFARRCYLNSDDNSWKSFVHYDLMQSTMGLSRPRVSNEKYKLINDQPP